MSVTSGSVTTIGEKYDGRYVQLTWTQNSSFNSETVSKIDWIATVEDDNSAGKSGWWYITSQVYFEVVCMQGTFRKSSDASTNTSNRIDILTYDNDRRQNVGEIGRGSFYITHDINGEAKFTINLKAAIYVWTINSTGSGTFTLPFKGGDVTTTSFLAGPGIIKPGSDYAIIWSGAKGGKSNSITGYKVYYTTDSTGPTAGDPFYETTKTKLEVTAPTTLNRGDQIRYKVQTIGQHGESTLSTATAVAQINRLPAAPSITNDSAIPTYYPVGGGRPTFKLDPGDDPDVGQTLSVYYATTASTSEKILCGKSFRPQVSTSTTYYFWTYDGLEFSNTSTSRYIEVETVEPSIMSVSATTSSYSARGASGFVNQVTPTIKTNTTGTVDMYIVYSSTASTDFENYRRQIQIPSEELTSSATSTNGQTLTTIPVEKYITEVYNNSKNFNYRLKFILRNENGRSESVFYPSNSYFSIAGAPGIIARTNKIGQTTNIAGSVDGHMGKEARITYQLDGSLDADNPEAVISCQTASGATFTLGEDDFTIARTTTTANILNVVLSDFLPNNSTVTIYVSLKTEYLTKTFKATYQTAKSPNLTKVAGIPSTFTPFDASGSVSAQMGWPFGSSVDISAAYTDYEFTSSKLKLYSTVDGTILQEYKYGDSTNLTWARDGDYLKATIPQSRLYLDDWKNGFSIEHYVGTYEYNVFMQITNVYGQIFESKWNLRTWNFNKAPELSTVVLTTYFHDYNVGPNGSNRETTNPQIVNQNGRVRFQTTLTYYSYQETFVELTRAIGDSVDNPIYIARIAESGGTHTLGDSIGAKTVSINYLYAVPEIDSITDWTWTLDAYNSFASSAEQTVTHQVIYHVPPIVTFSTFEIEEENGHKYLTGRFTVNDWGYDTTNNQLVLNTSDYLSKIFFYWYQNEVSTPIGNLDFPTDLSDPTGPIKFIVDTYLDEPGNTFEIYALPRTCLTYTGLSGIARTDTQGNYTPHTMMYKDAATMIYRPHGVGINGLTGNDIFQATALAPNSENNDKWRHNIRLQSYKYTGTDASGNVIVDANTTYTLIYNPSRALVTFYENGVAQHQYDLLKGTFR